MKKILLILSCVFLFVPFSVQAEEFIPEDVPEQEFFKAKVLSISLGDITDPENLSDEAVVEVLSGSSKGETVTVSLPQNESEAYQFEVGDTVVITKVVGYSGDLYYLTDRYRLPSLYWIFGLFVIFIIIFGRLRGLMSLLGLGVTVAVIMLFVIPRILAGDSPVLISVLGSIVILFFSIYLAHGFHWRTSVAVGATVISLALTAAMATSFVYVGKLFGLGSEEVLSLQVTQLANIDFRGLLLGGMILGTLGVLDDITTAQAAAIEQLKAANLRFGFWDLYKRGLSIGKEHITSLVNTLFLAYAGASLPVFLFFTVIPNVPAWVHLNSEFIAEEIVRTLVGSVGLILAVPITTLLAAYVFTRKTWAEHQATEHSVH